MLLANNHILPLLQIRDKNSTKIGALIFMGVGWGQGWMGRFTWHSQWGGILRGK